VSCCACAGETTCVLGLGMMYLSDFAKPGEDRGRQFPLRLKLCLSCGLLQQDEVTPRELVHHGRYSFKSGINEAIVADLKSIAAYAWRHAPYTKGTLSWLDIGCNDGTLLAQVPDGTFRVGVDPLGQFGDEAEQHADMIVEDYFNPGVFRPGMFKVITASAMIYDLADPAAFCEGVRQVLAPDGVFVVQQNSALDMLRNNVVDNIIHEHITYFSVTSFSRLLERCGLQIFDVAYADVKGGCIRTAVCHAGARDIQPSVAAALRAEVPYRLADPGTWQRWGKRTRLVLDETLAEIQASQARGEVTYLYGAATRSSTFLQMIGAGPDLIPYAADRDPAKVGKVMTATGIPVISEEQMRVAAPDYLLVGPWHFRDLFVNREADYLKGGGRMIFPLPQFEVVSG